MDGLESGVEPARPPLQAVLLAAVMIMMGLGVIVGGRPVLLSNHPRIDLVTDLPARADRAQIMVYVERGYLVPQRQSLWAAALRLPGRAAPPAPMLGWSVREVSMLGLPLFSYRELGEVVGVQAPFTALAAPVDAEQIAAIEREAGPLQRGWFPFWEHCWGLIAPLCVAGAIWLEARFQKDRREALGLI